MNTKQVNPAIGTPAAMILLTTAVSLSGCAHGFARNPGINRLVESERAFCRLARETSIRDAFLHYLSDDAVMLMPRPVNGKQVYEKRPASAAGLHWEPSFALISAAGDLGCTFGPWEYRKQRGQDTADAYGHFVSVWQLQPDGRWQVVFDSGISHQRPSEAPARLTLRTARGIARASGLNRQEQQAIAGQLQATDRDLSDSSSADNARQQLLSAMSDEINLFLETHTPVSGKTAASEILRSDTAAYRWQPARAIVSASNDLGYVYGTASSYFQGKTGGELSYLRIWERQPGGNWAIIVQKTNPIDE